jgi:branched-chain amino acid transport system ATP-binding protein
MNAQQQETGPVKALLELRRVSRSFGGVRAVREVSLALRQGEVIGLIGPNGAGKSTLVNVITGVHPAQSGEILHHGERIERLKPYQVAARGIARTFQVVQPFPEMTALENVVAGSLFAARKGSIKEAREAAMAHLEFTGLAPLADRPASQLTLANRKRLELAKGLAMEPKLLLLDEVNAGLNTAEIDRALGLIGEIAARGITVLIIEHLLKVVLTLCQRVIVLHHGELIADDTPGNIVKNEAVISAYLGARYAQRMKESRG